VLYICDVIVRPARSEEAKELAAVHHESSVAAYQHIAPAGPDGLARRETAWRDALAQPEHGCFVADDDGRAVGVLSVGPARDDATVGEVYVLYVHPDWWGTRAAQQLIECAHEILARDYTEAVLTVLADNPRARRFYERNGWVLHGLRQETHFGGIPTEVATYGKTLV
jgi:RimJ/RimL family protein N-acetyltransferase